MTLNSTERDDIAAAVRQAEAVTSAEIVVVVDRIAGSWRSWAMVVALIIALIVPWPLIEFTQFSTRTIFATQIMVAAVLIVLFQRQPLRLKLALPVFRRRKAHETALREFAARGLTATRDRTGVLIYVALAERYAEIITDTGISAVIDNDTWRQQMSDLIAAIGRGELAQGLADTVHQTARVLAPHFPPRSNDSDELDNKVVVI
jgi:putative membrane protein